MDYDAEALADGVRQGYLSTWCCYSLNALPWGRGLATEAARAVPSCVFERGLALARVLGGADPPDVRSLRVLDRLGMVEPVIPSPLPKVAHRQRSHDAYLGRR